jgi:hypothetical protein
MADGNEGKNGSSEDANGGSRADTKQTPTEPKAWFLKTAGAIVGTLGLGGSMVVIGSAVLWIRFREAGVPAVQAVAAQERKEVLVEGAHQTIVFVVIALVVVGILYVVDGLDIQSETEKGEEGETKDERKKEKETDPPRSADPLPTKQADKHQMSVRLCGVLVILPILGILWTIVATDLRWGAVLIVVVLGTALTIGSVWIAWDANKNFWALAGVVFVSVIAFSATAGYLIVKDQKYIQAVAVLDKSAEGSDLTGFYVAAEGEDLYVATRAGSAAVGPTDLAIRKIKLAENTNYAVGPLESVDKAELTSKALLAQLQSQDQVDAAVALALPAWAPSSKIETFTDDVKAAEEVKGTPLCLMRFADAVQADPIRPFWTSCAEAEAQATIQDPRQKLALPIRFQKNYVTRVKIEIPVGTKMHYLYGVTAPQCGGEKNEPCGIQYGGGGLQYWIQNPDMLNPVDLTYECTRSNADQNSVWVPGKCK